MTTKLLIDRELLPCPFCGGEPTVSSFPGAHNVWCSNQPVTCGNRSMYTSEQWNRRAQPAPAQGEAVAWARQCDLDESDPAIFVAREEVQESGYLVPLYTTPPQPAEVGELANLLRHCASDMEDWRMSFPDANSTVTDGLLVRIDAALAKLEGKA